MESAGQGAFVEGNEQSMFSIQIIYLDWKTRKEVARIKRWASGRQELASYRCIWVRIC